jgi:hypothetical protein
VTHPVETARHETPDGGAELRAHTSPSGQPASLAGSDPSESASIAPDCADFLLVSRDDVEAVVNLIERAIYMLRERWNAMPVDETDAFVRIRARVDGGKP